jgi:hypothetical protein
VNCSRPRHGAFGLVGGAKDSRSGAETRKAAGVESGGWSEADWLEARRAAFSQSIARLQQATGAAVSTLLGTWAAWLYDLLKPHVTKVVVCNPRKNALLKTGNKSDRIDARKLAELLRAGLLSAVYHGETGLRALKELSRSYPAISKDRIL